MMRYLKIICLFAVPQSLFGHFIVDSGEFITLSPFVVEARLDDSQFKGSGLAGMAGGSPFQSSGSLSEQLDWVLGVSLERRGLHSVEPVILGMGFDRVVTSLNGIYLPNAAPTRTAAPINFFGSTGQLSLNVIRSLPSVVHGPVPIGSRILIESIDFSWDLLQAKASYDLNAESLSTTLTLRRSGQNFPISLGVHFSENADYTGGGSAKVVDSDYRASGLQLNGMVYAGGRNATIFTAQYCEQELSRNTSLPLDTKDTPTATATINHSVDLENGVLSIRAGYTRSRPFLTSEDRTISPDSPLERVEAQGETSSYTLALGRIWESSGGFVLEAGVDCTVQDRQMSRTRLLKNGTRFEDLLWPDLESIHTGTYVEVREASWKKALQWRIGARIGKASNRANRLDSQVSGVPGARGSTIRDNFVAFHGSESAGGERHDWTGATNLLLEYRMSERLTLHGGIGYTVATPGLGERFRSFVNALGGGVEIGNPTLKREKKTEFHTGATWSADWGKLSISGYYATVDHFVERSVISADPLIYSFHNRDARFFGTQASLEYYFFQYVYDSFGIEDLMSELSMPITLSYTRGEEAGSGTRLAEIPPLEAVVGIRYYKDIHFLVDAFWFTVMGRYVAAQENPQPLLVPVYHDTDASVLVDLELSLEISYRWKLLVQAANLFDKEAYSYLQPSVATGPVGPSSGTLSGGDRIPLPGRSLLFAIEFEF